MTTKHTPGPWPWEYTGDRKRIVIGEGLVEGPNGYEVAEVYSDDCDPEEAEANARLIAAAPELVEALRNLRGRFEEAAKWRHNAQDWDSEEGWVEGQTLLEWFLSEASAALAKIDGEKP